MKREIIIPAFIAFLGLVFIIIKIAVFFTKGNKWFIKKKIKVGALIISFTTFYLAILCLKTIVMVLFPQINHQII